MLGTTGLGLLSGGSLALAQDSALSGTAGTGTGGANALISPGDSVALSTALQREQQKDAALAHMVGGGERVASRMGDLERLLCQDSMCMGGRCVCKTRDGVVLCRHLPALAASVPRAHSATTPASHSPPHTHTSPHAPPAARRFVGCTRHRRGYGVPALPQRVPRVSVCVWRRESLDRAST